MLNRCPNSFSPKNSLYDKRNLLPLRSHDFWGGKQGVHIGSEKSDMWAHSLNIPSSHKTMAISQHHFACHLTILRAVIFFLSRVAFLFPALCKSANFNVIQQNSIYMSISFTLFHTLTTHVYIFYIIFISFILL